MSPRPRFPLRAFTLVEVMMAATIVVVAFIGMIEAIAVMSSSMAHARRQVFASQIIDHEIEKLRSASWNYINGLPPANVSNPTSIAIDLQFWPNWSARTNYQTDNVVSFAGSWYRCLSANSNQAPTNTLYWDEVTTAIDTDIVTILGAQYVLTRYVTNPLPNIKEVNFTVTWIVPTSRHAADGTPLNFSYKRSNSAWFGQFGLNLSYQKS
ncbi:MAG: hypothetical protein JWM32_72 [Verrucomicrobia bacterium]|nr:hypothetical protein [Verrucomicrobiota bacterium]